MAVTSQGQFSLSWQIFCTGQQQLWRGSVNFRINSRPLFTIIFKLKNVSFKIKDFSPLTYSTCSRWCAEFMDGVYFDTQTYIAFLIKAEFRVRVCGCGGGDSVMYQTLSLQVIFWLSSTLCFFKAACGVLCLWDIWNWS